MIKQAIVPLAGLGTRLLPLTSVLPKELLPINGKPGLEYILDECIEAGIKDIILIISKKKSIIKDYFKQNRVTHTYTNCQWPIGDPQEKDFHFCGKERFDDKSYCLEHCTIAYVLPEKEEELTAVNQVA